MTGPAPRAGARRARAERRRADAGWCTTCSTPRGIVTGKLRLAIEDCAVDRLIAEAIDTVAADRGGQGDHDRPAASRPAWRCVAIAIACSRCSGTCCRTRSSSRPGGARSRSDAEHAATGSVDRGRGYGHRDRARAPAVRLPAVLAGAHAACRANTAASGSASRSRATSSRCTAAASPPPARAAARGLNSPSGCRRSHTRDHRLFQSTPGCVTDIRRGLHRARVHGPPRCTARCVAVSRRCP